MVWRAIDQYPQSDSTCTVYLLHFSRPFKHAKHYIGVVSEGRDVESRLVEHRSGKGANLCKHAVQAGVDLVLARLWEDVPRYTERKLKNRGGASRLCPICKELSDGLDCSSNPSK